MVSWHTTSFYLLTGCYAKCSCKILKASLKSLKAFKITLYKYFYGIEINLAHRGPNQAVQKDFKCSFMIYHQEVLEND